ncbi:MAG: HAD family hydrolase [Chloroflexota bacterium]
MAYRALLFDLDGTLLDTLRDIADSVNRALTSLGFPQHELDAYRYFVGEGVEALATRALPENRRDQITVSKLTARIDEEYSLRWANNSRPYRGIPELLDNLTGLGIRLAVLSNKAQGFAEKTVSRLLPYWHFELVVGAVPSVPKKPDPAAALQIARQMDLMPGEFLYLGDSAVDMKTASAANMYPVGALWGFRTADELLSGGAKALVKEPLDVLSLLYD